MGLVLYPEELRRLIEVEFHFIHRTLSTLSSEEKESVGIHIQDHDLFPYHLCSSFPAAFTNLIRGQPSAELLNHLPSILDEIMRHQDFVYLAVMPDNASIPFIHKILDLGFQPSGFEDIWVKDLDQVDPEEHPSLIRVTADNLENYIQVANTAFEMEGEVSRAMTTITRGMFRDERNTLFGHMDNEQMVGAGLCHVSGDTAYLGGGSTLEAYRGKQIQQHLLIHRMWHAKKQGAKYAVVTTSVNTTSGRNMLRLGLQKVTTITNYRYEQQD